MLRRKKRRPVDRTDLIAASALREKQFTVRATGFDPATVDMVVQRLAAELDVLELQLPDPSGQPKPGSVAAEVQQIMLGGHDRAAAIDVDTELMLMSLDDEIRRLGGRTLTDLLECPTEPVPAVTAGPDLVGVNQGG